MKLKNNISPVLMIMAICLHYWAAPIFAEEKSNAVRCANGKLNIQAQNVPLGMIMEEIKNKCRVNIFGLDGRVKEPITFTASEELPENALKRLLRQLDEDNYALEYSRAGLNRVSVVPKAMAKGSSPPAAVSPPFPFTPPPPPQPEAPPPVVSVIDIIPGSQGESVGLQKGDVVLDYDGTKISDSQQLIQEVKSKESKPTVEVTVLRNNTPMTFVLKGGFIGVNIANSNPK
ncbi:MAG: hypothetical protein BWK80_24395 [Desulfobacteraceae bacterium IS3]|nr:MAG: hypothetical protein BWK80_24395 [Desulfobacteraceae bacterium IS3]